MDISERPLVKLSSSKLTHTLPNRVLEHQKMIDPQAQTVRLGGEKKVFADKLKLNP